MWSNDTQKVWKETQWCWFSFIYKEAYWNSSLPSSTGHCHVFIFPWNCHSYLVKQKGCQPKTSQHVEEWRVKPWQEFKFPIVSSLSGWINQPRSCSLLGLFSYDLSNLMFRKEGKKREGKRKAGDEIGKEGWERHKITTEF